MWFLCSRFEGPSNVFLWALKDMEAGRRKGERCGSMICSMSFRSIAHLVVLLLVFIGNGTFCASALKYASITSPRLARIQRHLEKINKPAVRSIEVRIMVKSHRERERDSRLVL